MEFIDMIKRSAMKLGRGLRHVKTNKDGVHGEEDPDKKITVGICVLEKKALSSPMTEILDRLRAFGEFDIIMFGDNVILKEPVEKWPVVECLIAFYSNGYPLDKVIKYAKLRKPFMVNELESQYLLHDRRKVYAKLEEYSIAVPNYIVVNRDQPNEDVETFIEDEDWIELNGKRVHKPFVEKPVDGDDHSVMIYYPSTAGGGMKELFRKVGNRASEFHPEIRRVRRDGSYLYEEFMPTGGTDVKVYTVGPDYAHAEARKSPVVDGVVQRSKDGKEVRFPVLLSPEEKTIAHDVCTVFGQAVCGFDLLRSNGRSYVCDVNGWSFVKNSYKYYDDAACVLRCMFIAAAAPFQDISLPPTLPWKSQGNASPTIERHGSYGPSTFGRTEELRCVIAVIRHGDRTPKQKVKLKIHSERLLNLMLKYNGGRPRAEAKLKSAVQLQDLLDACRQLIPRMRTGRESDSEAEDIEHAEKLRHVKAVLEEGGHFSGIYRKVQLKPLQWVKEVNDTGEEVEKVTEALLILKYGGVLTHAGRQQAESLGKDFRNNMYPGEGTGLLRLHSTYRHDLKIYTSDEGRVQMSAAAFTKGLLDLEGQLTPILVSLVSRDAAMLDIVDPGADQMMETSKKFLFEAYSNDRGPEAPEDPERPWMVDGGGIPENPLKLLQRLVQLTKLLTAQLKDFCKEEDYAAGSTSGSEDAACYVSLEARALGKADLDQDRVEAGLPCGSENFLLMFARWKKLEKDMYNERKDKYDISKIPDIYDCAKYDLLHNPHLNLTGLDEIFAVAKALADGVIPNEYGINPVHKLRIGSKICRRLVGKILIDFWNTREETLSVAKLTSEPSGHWKPVNKNTWRPTQSSTAKLSSLGNTEVSGAKLGNPETSASAASLAPSETSSVAPGGSLPGTFPQGEVPGAGEPGNLPRVIVPGGSVPGTVAQPETPGASTPSIMVGESASGPPSAAEMAAMKLGRLEVGENRRVSDRTSDKVSDRVSEKAEDEPESPSSKSEGRGEEASYRLNPKYANVKTPQRHVRTRLYFTSESHIHSLINVLRYCHFDDKLGDQEPLISEEALQRLYETKELDYLTHIVLRLYENTEVPINDVKRFRVDLQYSSGAALSPLEVTPRGRDHVLPILPREPLQNVGTYLSLEQLEVMLKPFAMPVEEFPPPAGYPAVRHDSGDPHHRHRNQRTSATGYILPKVVM